ncbi:MAG: sodium:proton antiporter [Firmicutes bacterium]|nr:sodium:proton antiporter [Bacillota bacterium]
MKDFVLKRIVIVLLPFIQMYGLYVIFHGHVSPGGSFAGGMILGLGFVAFATVFGLDRGRQMLPEKVTTLTESYGTLWYGIMGMIGIFKGFPFLANKLAGIDVGVPGTLTSGGLISWIGLGVGIRVASTITTLFFTMMEEKP